MVGKGEVHAARRPVVGRDKVITFQSRTRPAVPPRFALATVNGAPALVYVQAPGVPAGTPPSGVIQLEVDDEGRIARILACVAPSKTSRFLARHPVP